MRGRWAIGALALVALVDLAGCYTGAARPFDVAALDTEPGWIAVEGVPELRQDAVLGCGDVAAAMLLQHWGLQTTPDEVRSASGAAADQGLTAGFLRDYLRARGLEAFLFAGTFTDLERELSAGRPVVVGVAKPYSNDTRAHYQVVIGLRPIEEDVLVLDPADGVLVYSFGGFAQEWEPTGFLTLVVSPRAPLPQ